MKRGLCKRGVIAQLRWLVTGISATCLDLSGSILGLEQDAG